MNILKKFHICEIALIVIIFAIHSYAAFSDAYNLPNTWYTRDDAYYYFKVAQNITEGRGSTFDGINPTNGYHPLWMMVCIPVFFLARFDLILPLRVLTLVIAGLNAATAILIFRLVREHLSLTVAFLAAPFWAFNLYIHDTIYKFGLETPLAAFAIMLFLFKLSQFERQRQAPRPPARQIATLAVIAALVMFSRLDLIFLATIAGIWIVLRNNAGRSLIPTDIVIILFSTTSAVALRTGIDAYNDLYAQSTIRIAAFAVAVKLISLYLTGSYQKPNGASIGYTLRRTGAANLIGSTVVAAIVLLIPVFGGAADFPKGALILDWAICSTLTSLNRLAVYWFGRTADAAREPVISPLAEIISNWRRWLAEGMVYYGIVYGALCVYMLFNKIAFGTFTPVSGQIKQWWGTIGNTVYDYPARNWSEFMGVAYEGVYNAWQPISKSFIWIAIQIKPLYRGADTQDERFFIALAGVALIMGLVFILNKRHTREKIDRMALVPLISASCVQIMAYTTSSYGGAKEWYWVGQTVLLVLLLSVFIDGILKPFHDSNLMRSILGLVFLSSGAFLAMRLGGQVIGIMRYNYFPPERPYMEVLPYLEENTPPGSMIGMTGGGNVGYFLRDRTIVNMDGLINSYQYFRAVQNRGAPEYLKEHGMDFVFANGGLLQLPPYYDQFAPYTESFSTYGGKSLFYLLEDPKF